MPDKNSSVLVFRKRMLPYSETFIADQGHFLSRYKATFTGFYIDHSGIDLLSGDSVQVLEQSVTFKGFSKLLFRLGLPVTNDWIESLKKMDANLIHAHFLKDGVDAIQLGKILNIPLVTTLHGHDITKHEKHSNFKKGSQFLFEHVDRVIAVSNYIAQHALRKGCPENKLIQHSIGIDLEHFVMDKNESDTPELLFVGRLTEKKGCTYLLQAMHKLKKKYPDLLLTIVGDGGLKSELESEVSSYALNVDFCGVQNALQIRDRLSRCWLFVAPSITANNGDAEGLGMVFLEAQALQTPVVSFRSGGVVEAVEDEITGLLCEEKDVSSLAENIDTLLQSETLRRKMGKKGRARVESHFDIRKQCRLLESIYDNVSDKG